MQCSPVKRGKKNRSRILTFVLGRLLGTVNEEPESLLPKITKKSTLRWLDSLNYTFT